MKTTQVSTKGILNQINERYKCNSKRNTVPVMNLIRFHKPKQNAELTALIASHQVGHAHENCECGCKSNGTVETFADKLYDSYLDYCTKNEGVPYKNSEDALIFMKHLFVINALKGDKMENKYMNSFNDYFKEHSLNYKCITAPTLYDFKYSVDLLIEDVDGKEVGFIQVKPVSYKNFPRHHQVVQINIEKNKLLGEDVTYVYYDKNTKFTESIKDSVNKMNLK